MLYSKEQLEIAEKLIKSAHIFAVGTYTPMLDKFPELESVAKSNLLEFWDCLITIAGVGTAFMETADSFPEEEIPGITCAIRDKLNEWQSDSYNVMVDFIHYVDKLVDSGVEIPAAIGGWIWVNLEKHDQSTQRLRELASSLKLVKVVGIPIFITFHNWWKQTVNKSVCQAREEKGEVLYIDGIKVDLAEEEAKEAINWGAGNKDSIKNIFLPYSFGEPEIYQEGGAVLTKTYALAMLSCRLAREHKSLDRAEIEEILNSDTLGIAVTTYGSKADFLKGSRILLKQGNKTIHPVRTETEKQVESTEDFSVYRGHLVGYFRYSEIDLKARTTVILVKKRGESRFEVDFSRYK